MRRTPDPSEHDYAAQARVALDKGDLRLALEQIGGALSFRPMSPEHLATLELILARTPNPLDLLPQRGTAFFGAAAVRAWALVRAGRLNEGILQLLDVAQFRPNTPYLMWLADWCTEHGLRGVAADAVAASCGRFLASVDRDGDGEGVIDNLEAVVCLLAALREARPKAVASLATFEAMALRRLNRALDAIALIDRVLPIAKSSALLVQRAQALAAAGELEGSVAAMQGACRESPGDWALQADLADSLMLTGRFMDADAGYTILATNEDELLRSHALLGRGYIASLLAPSDELLRHTALERAGSASKRGRELVPLLWLYRSELPAVEDPLSGALLSVLTRVRAEPPPGPIRLRVKLDGAVPATARLLFNAGLAELGLTGSIENDGERSQAHPGVSGELDPSLDARARSLAQSPLAIDGWCVAAAGVPLATARVMFDKPLVASDDPTVALDRSRLAVLALATAGMTDPADPAVKWLCALARGEDAWAARPALMVLAALARSRPAMRDVVLAAFAAANELQDVRRITLLGCWCLLPDLTHEVRGAHYKAWQQARRLA